MEIAEALSQFYSQQALGQDGGRHVVTVVVYAGPWTVRLPNTPARKRLLPFHDTHHVVTGYGTDRVGEAQLCAWEIGTGSFREPMAFLMNVVGLFTGLLYGPRKVYEAYRFGCASRSTYGKNLEDEILRSSLQDLRRDLLPDSLEKGPRLTEAFGFGLYALFALILGVALIALAGLQRLSARYGGGRAAKQGSTALGRGYFGTQKKGAARPKTLLSSRRGPRLGVPVA